MTFDEAFNALMLHEGGYSDHSADPGGKTRYGITEAVARAEGFTGDLREYPISDAKRVYRKRYWEPLRLESVRPDLRFDLFDAAVNSGVSQAIKWAQRILFIRDDGVMGPDTLNALMSTNSAKFLQKFNGQRLMFMTTLPTWNAFGRGWARRIAENLTR